MTYRSDARIRLLKTNKTLDCQDPRIFVLIPVRIVSKTLDGLDHRRF